jgi:hypothetical protein
MGVQPLPQTIDSMNCPFAMPFLAYRACIMIVTAHWHAVSRSLRPPGSGPSLQGHLESTGITAASKSTETGLSTVAVLLRYMPHCTVPAAAELPRLSAVLIGLCLFGTRRSRHRNAEDTHRYTLTAGWKSWRFDRQRGQVWDKPT